MLQDTSYRGNVAPFVELRRLIGESDQLDQLESRMKGKRNRLKTTLSQYFRACDAALVADNF